MGYVIYPTSRLRRPGFDRACFFAWRQPPRTEVRAIKEQKVRVNDQIRISPIRLIDADGGQVGIVSLDDARGRALEAGLDLVEVAPDARPPVCRLMDYGKFKYEEARRAREARKKQHTIQVKEVKYRPGIEEHDYEFKTRHVRRFLEDGDKVKVTMMFRGRQLAHPEFGLEVLERVLGDVEDVGKIESQPTREGRTMTIVIAPVNTKV
jgi:translation initiation factor IF-3